MTNKEAIEDIKNNILPVVGGKSLVMAIKALENERPTGNWIKCNFHNYGERVYWNYKCTNCEAVYSTQYNYCPDCGAEMKQEAENE